METRVDYDFALYAPATTGPLIVTEVGIASNSITFSVENLSVTGISPTLGSAGSLVTITGTGFGSSQTSSTVDFYGTPAPVQTWSDTQIVAFVPTDAATGSVNVGVGGVEYIGLETSALLEEHHSVLVRFSARESRSRLGHRCFTSSPRCR